MALPAVRQVFQLKVTLVGSRPPIWRRLLVPTDFTLGDLHHVLQWSFGWEDEHLHEFVVRGQHYGPPDPDGFDQPAHDEDLATLRDVVRTRSKLRYDYDFGDSWRHDIVVEKTIPAIEGAHYPTCTAGKRAGPPEDSGGIWGYEEKVAIFSDATHPDHEEIVDWMGEDFSPDAFDLAEINRSLHALCPAPAPAPARAPKRSRR